jgi:hypothetical protein
MEKRFGDSARAAVLLATGACAVLSAVAVLNDLKRHNLDGASYATLWVVFWPLTFAASLWYDVRRNSGRQMAMAVSKVPRAD